MNGFKDETEMKKIQDEEKLADDVGRDSHVLDDVGFFGLITVAFLEVGWILALFAFAMVLISKGCS